MKNTLIALAAVFGAMAASPAQADIGPSTPAVSNVERDASRALRNYRGFVQHQIDAIAEPEIRQSRQAELNGFDKELAIRLKAGATSEQQRADAMEMMTGHLDSLGARVNSSIERQSGYQFPTAIGGVPLSMFAHEAIGLFSQVGLIGSAEAQSAPPTVWSTSKGPGAK